MKQNLFLKCTLLAIVLLVVMSGRADAVDLSNYHAFPFPEWLALKMGMQRSAGWVGLSILISLVLSTVFLVIVRKKKIITLGRLVCRKWEIYILVGLLNASIIFGGALLGANTYVSDLKWNEIEVKPEPGESYFQYLKRVRRLNKHCPECDAQMSWDGRYCNRCGYSKRDESPSRRPSRTSRRR